MKGSTLKELNSRLLCSQFLSERARGSESLVQIASGCCGINSQNLSDSFLSFWARSASFSDQALTKEMGPGGDLLRMWTVRCTVHTFPARDYYTNVFGSPRDRVLSSHDRYARQLGLPGREERIRML